MCFSLNMMFYYLDISGYCMCKATFTNYSVTVELARLNLTDSLFKARTASCVWRSMLFKDSCQRLIKQTLLSLAALSLPLSSLTFSFSCLFQASNGNDPWSVWNADPSGGSNNNWASNPEGTQTGKTAADPWSAASQGHPQAYQGPGKEKLWLFDRCLWSGAMHKKKKLHSCDCSQPRFKTSEQFTPGNEDNAACVYSLSASAFKLLYLFAV